MHSRERGGEGLADVPERGRRSGEGVGDAEVEVEDEARSERGEAEGDWMGDDEGEEDKGVVLMEGDMVEHFEEAKTGLLLFSL